jgi:hypothetical protein
MQSVVIQLEGYGTTKINILSKAAPEDETIPAIKDPATEEPITEEVATEEPITEETITEAPTNEPPVTEAPSQDDVSDKKSGSITILYLLILFSLLLFRRKVVKLK